MVRDEKEREIMRLRERDEKGEILLANRENQMGKLKGKQALKGGRTRRLIESK